TCINSGVMIHSFSAAKTVVMPDMCSARDYKDKDFIYIYNDNDIEGALNRAYNAGKDKNCVAGLAARDEMNHFNNIDEVEKAILSAIG
ncbi:MAG: hypothetical protein IJL20_14985, partial [Lachnospiraceae bacterium]|nr:hypothetical protein [Lachnospiraceae bacterium]